ncbi:MAG TPA: type II toxin-antitoxin system VapC family toxin [Candidatus Limnocylindria bacterium]|nr:type II toxin-antitoxin system VapC family toxin [Candidatus Limnocylindria bacterium]
MTRLAYADASALVKLIHIEPESGAFHHWYVAAERVATSRVGVVEVDRAARRRTHDAERRSYVLRNVDVIELGAAIGAAAGVVVPPALRTIDSIHIASALALGSELDAFVTYDDRLADAARSVGLPVVRPA